ncbi:hypothetical protein [Streptomyces sp. NPDC004050]
MMLTHAFPAQRLTGGALGQVTRCHGLAETCDTDNQSGHRCILVAMDKPRSGLAWLEIRRGQPGNASQLLRRLGLGETPLTHDAFHELQLWRAATHLEEFLMTCGVLPAADKYLCSFQR